MSRRNALLLALLATLALSVLPHLVDRYEERIDRGPGIAALRNPFLAAERFLAASGVHAGSIRRWQELDRLDQRVGTVILSDSRLILSEPQLERLLEWVDAGGNLIVGAPPPSDDEQDLLFSRFGLSTHRVERPDKKHAKKIREVLRELEEQKHAAERPVPPEQLTEVEFAGEERPLRAHFALPRFLHHPALDEDEDTAEGESEDNQAADAADSDAAGDADETRAEDAEQADGDQPAEESPVESETESDSAAGEALLISVAGNANGPQMLRFSYGLGRLTVVTSTGIWDFRRIERFEHAYLLYRLVDPERFGTEVRVLYDRDMPSLASLVRRHAWQPLVAGALLLAAWLWHRGRRFGAAQEPLSSGRRALAEHLQASAAYLWRNGQSLRLLDAMRAAVRARAPQVSEAALPALLARRSGIALDAVKEALRERTQTIDEERFTELSRRLQQLRDSL